MHIKLRSVDPSSPSIVHEMIKFRRPKVGRDSDVEVCDVQAGGPRYEPLYGRLDGRTSRAEDAIAVLPRARDPMDKLIANFASQNFSSQEMLALLGTCIHSFSFCLSVKQASS